MASMKSLAARKTVKATAKHSAHGTASKLRRKPLRTVTLLGAGALVGGFAGWTAGRSSASPSAG